MLRNRYNVALQLPLFEAYAKPLFTNITSRWRFFGNYFLHSTRTIKITFNLDLNYKSKIKIINIILYYYLLIYTNIILLLECIKSSLVIIFYNSAIDRRCSCIYEELRNTNNFYV